MNGQSRSTEHFANSDRVQRILREIPLIDGHNDWPWNIRNWFQSEDVTAGTSDLNSIPIGQTDIKRLQAGRVGGQFWSAFVPCPKTSTELPDEAHVEIVRQTLQQIDIICMMAESYPTCFGLARNVSEVWDVFKSGRLACLIGIEGLHQIGNSLSILRTYRSLGVRYVTLTHNTNNIYADSATAEEIHGGLSDRGSRAVQEMNRIGLMIDLSHTSAKVQEQVLQMSRAPVIFSHSSCFSLTPHRRNASDKVLDMIKENGGIIMICFLRDLVKPINGSEPTVSDVADHIIYAGSRIGYEHVGIGSDFDGMLSGPNGLDEVSDYPNLVAMLLNREIPEDKVKQVVGLNILRVLQAVEDVSAGLRNEPTSGLRPVPDGSIISSWSVQERNMLIDEGARRRLRRELCSDRSNAQGLR